MYPSIMHIIKICVYIKNDIVIVLLRANVDND